MNYVYDVYFVTFINIHILDKNANCIHDHTYMHIVPAQVNMKPQVVSLALHNEWKQGETASLSNCKKWIHQLL